MTADEKKQRRAIRHALQKEALKNQSVDIRLMATPRRLMALAKTMTDRAIARGVLNS